MKAIVIGNWKMKITTVIDAQILARSVEGSLRSLESTDVVMCPSHVHLVPVMHAGFGGIMIGAQNCHKEPKGSFTGSVSPTQLRDIGVSYVLLGHSERRKAGETNGDVNIKVRSVMRAGMIPVVCLGEDTRDDTDSYKEVIKTQVRESLDGVSSDELASIIIAYEPVWAIGSKANRECTPIECKQAIETIHETLGEMHQGMIRKPRVIYGGSVNRDNVAGYILHGKANGVLPGRASLDPDHFVDIVRIVESHN